MNHDGWKPGWTRGSKLEEIVWLGKDALAWCSGVHIVFLDIVHKKQSVYWCWDQDTGDGARCLSSHASYPVFAFAERNVSPRILVLAYPSMGKIAECAGGCQSGYIATAFAAGDHLVSVGSYSQFPMTIWNWRTGEKVTTVNTTSIRDDVGQILRITQLGPCVVAQMGRTCGKLFTWELDVILKIAILKDHEIKLPKEVPILWVDWCPTSREPLLAVTDVDGHIYLSNYNGSDVQRIVLSQRCGICVELETPLVSWFREGIVLRTTFCQIRFFARNIRTNFWRKEWYVKSETRPYILLTHPLRNNLFFYYTLEGHLMQVDFPEDSKAPQITKYLDYGATHRFASFVYPWCHHLVVTCDLKELTVLECYEGTPVSTVDPETRGEISSLASHPDLPLTILGTEHGELILLSLVEPIDPKIVARLRLQRSSLDLIKFSNTGRSLIAAEKRTGDCYVVSLQRERMYTVQSLVKVRRAIADLLIFEGHRRLRILVLYVAVKQYDVGQQLFVFEVFEDQNLVSEFIHILKLPGVYRSLWQVPGNPTVLVGSPYLTRQLRVQRLQDFKLVTLEDALLTGHHVKLACLFVDRSWITTTALDGLVLVRDKTVRLAVAHIMTHHRSDWGSVRAMANRQGDLIVCLGYNGSLIATKATAVNKKEHSESTTASSKDQHRACKVEHGLYEKMLKKITSDYASLDHAIHESLTRPTYEFPDPKDGDKTWTEWREDEQIREEEEKYREEKAAILKDFEVLRGKVKQLLDANEASPEIEKLPVSAFDLDIKGRDQKLKAGRDVCENLHLELEHNIFEMQRVAKWIKEAFWDPQTVIGKCMFAIFGSAVVTNYPAVAGEPHAEDRVKWANFCKKTAYSILEDDRFEPWKTYTNEQLEVELNKKMKLHRGEERRIDLLLDFDDDEDESIVDVDVDVQKALHGTTTHRFIEPSHYYPQVGYYGFSQVMINSRLMMHDSEKLRAYFNSEFDEVYSMKERETSVIRERIDRIRYIDSELRSMFSQRVPYIPADPKWHWQERPETIIKVQKHEVQAKPYVSPSQQELLDKQAAEEERIRQLLLADDFRERALMAMMDGVLEVRWEDTIKIDVPKPACMLEKKPEDYTAEDVQAVKQYEKDVQFLTEERERYKRMLEAEYGKVMGLLNDGIDRFNGKLEELFYLKLNVEAAVNQLSLRYIRGWLLIRNQRKCMEKEDELKKRISEREQYRKVVDEQLQALRHKHDDMVSKQTTLVNKDKAMAKRFRAEFPYLNKLNIELLERQYARRPRTNLRNLQASDFLDLASQVATRTPCVYLPTECKDYARVLHNLEVRPATLPPTIESHHWEQLIRVRRNKIESELKVRGKQKSITDLLDLILAFEEKAEKCKRDVEDAKKSLLDLRKRCSIEELNVEFQLVLKMGQVEVDLGREAMDSENAIFIPNAEIENVNKLIRAAGKCKLDALSRLLSFQRGTLLKEWKHECEKKRLGDLEEDLRFLDSVTVTKEMQRYLKRKAMGLPDDKTPQQLSDDIAAITRRCEEVVGDHRARLEAIQKEIAAVRCRNERLDRQILEMNVERCEMEQRRDLIGEERQREHAEWKLRMVMHRSELIKKLQDNYAELLELQTEHELLRLKRYPTLHFRMLDDKDGDEEGRRGEPRTRPC